MHEVIVVGAGPAGSAAATVLARSGRDVLLVDHTDFPRDKPCGDGMSPMVTTELEKLCAWDAVRAANFHIIHSVRYVSPNEHVIEALESRENEGRSFVAPRTRFDHILKEHATASGATFHRTHVTAPIIENGRVQGVVARKDQVEQELRAPVVIVADGNNSVLATTLRKRKHPPRHTILAIKAYVRTTKEQPHAILLHFLKEVLPGYAWIFPVSSDLVNVGVGTTLVRNRQLRRPLRAILDDFLKVPYVREQFGEATMVTKPQAWMLNLACMDFSRVFPGALLAGDAGAFINSATGAGVASALTTGRLAGEVTHAALHSKATIDDALLDFDQRWKQELESRFKQACLVRRLFLGRTWPINWFIERSYHHPHLRRILAEWIIRFS